MMPKLTQAQEQARDARDLTALALLDEGNLTKTQICASMNMARGPFVRMLKEIREDEAPA